MKRTILYYPTIDIPSNSWLRNALLYWDEVSSIVPMIEDDQNLQLSPDVNYLMEQGLFRPIRPEKLYEEDRWDVLDDFHEEFKKIIDSERFKRRVLMNCNDRERCDNIKYSKVHSHKISDGVIDFLTDRGLAERRWSYDKCYKVEENAALIFISLLAKYLADIDHEYTVIGTDCPLYERFNYKPTQCEEGFPVINLIMNKVLPTPNENVPFEKGIDFKTRRIDNLMNFRLTLSSFQKKISAATSTEELKSVSLEYQDKITKGVIDLESVLKDSKIRFSLKALKALSKTNLDRSLILSPFSKYIPLITGLNFMTKISISYIEKRHENNINIRNSPFSYVYYARQYNILNVDR